MEPFAKIVNIVNSWNSSTISQKNSILEVWQDSEYASEIVEIYTVRKVSIFGIILVHIFPHSDWILRISPCSARMQEDMDQNNSEYGHSLWNDNIVIFNLCQT